MTSKSETKFSFEDFKNYVGPQLVGSGFPYALWQKAFDKLNAESFDAGNSFQLAALVSSEDSDEEAVEETESGKEPADNVVNYCLLSTTDLQPGQDVWIIDHAWTFRFTQALACLQSNEQLLQRCEKLVGAHGVTEVYETLFKKAYHYRIATESQLDEEDCWYLLDEVGSALEFSTDPSEINCSVAPLFFPPTGCAFSLLWVNKVVPAETKMVTNAPSRNDFIRSMLYSSAPLEGTALQFIIDANEVFERRILENRNEKLVKWLNEPYTSREALPPFETTGPIRIYTDVPELQQFSSSTEGFAPAQSFEEADMLWLSTFIPADTALPRSVRFFNQFGTEKLFCNKENMAKLVRSELGFPSWLPRTYNADELQNFAGDYFKRAQNGENNTWIVKPTTMARSMDMVISDSFTQIIRMTDTCVPKVISKYVEDPLLFSDRKFDLRFIVAVRSFETLDAYIYDRFWPRFALEQFSLNDFTNFNKHFTVHNYTGKGMIDMRCDSFIKALDEEHGSGTWMKCLKGIKNMLREFFCAVSVACVDYCNAQNKDLDVFMRAGIFGIDCMVTDLCEPKLLEITFSPDCHRACEHYEDFYSDVMAVLLKAEQKHFTKL